MAHRVPRAHAEAGQVQHGEHARHRALPHQRGVGLVQEIVEEHRLPQVQQRAAHARIMRLVKNRFAICVPYYERANCSSVISDGTANRCAGPQ